MQFFLQENINAQNAKKQNDPADIAIPFNAGRRTESRTSSQFETTPPSKTISLLTWINNRIQDGTIVETTSHVALTGSGSPEDVVTSRYVGDIYIDTAGDVVYIALGANSQDDWGQINVL
jgi:hypothetical protein